MTWHFCFYARCKSHSERRYLGSPSGKSPHWGRTLSSTIWLGESCWVEHKCFSQKIQIFSQGRQPQRQQVHLHSSILRHSRMNRMDEQSMCQTLTSHHGTFCHGLHFWYGQYIMLGRPLSAPTSLCIQFLQISGPQKVVILFVVPCLLTDSCLSNLCRKRENFENFPIYWNKICATGSENKDPFCRCGTKWKQSFKYFSLNFPLVFAF